MYSVDSGSIDMSCRLKPVGNDVITSCQHRRSSDRQVFEYSIRAP